MPVVLDDSELQRAMRQMVSRSHAVAREVLPPMAEALHAGVLDVWEAQGPGWDPFAESTLAGPRGRGSPKLLQDSGVSIDTLGLDFDLEFIEVFASTPYMVFHTSDKPRKKIPLRNPFELGPFEEPTMREIEAIALSSMERVA